MSLKFFVGENMNPDGMVALLDFREDGVTPYMIFFKDGLEIEKCVSTDSSQAHSYVMALYMHHVFCPVPAENSCQFENSKVCVSVAQILLCIAQSDWDFSCVIFNYTKRGCHFTAVTHGDFMAEKCRENCLVEVYVVGSVFKLLKTMSTAVEHFCFASLLWRLILKYLTQLYSVIFDLNLMPLFY